MEHNVFVIAEAGVNHNGDLDLGRRLIDAAATSGADAVKFQTFNAADMVSRDAPKADYQVRTTDRTESQFDMIKRLELDEDAHRELISHARARGIAFLSSPFDLAGLDLLTLRFGLAQIKLGSGELTNGPLLLAAARRAEHMIVSTGMGTLGEVETALKIIAFGLASPAGTFPDSASLEHVFDSREGRAALSRTVTLLHCTSSYPAAISDVNLRAMRTLRDAFGLRVGYSDHTLGSHVSVAAVAAGASVIEKHLTIDRTLPGPDHAASLEPAEFHEMVQQIRDVQLAMGDGIKRPSKAECATRDVARKSLVAATAIEQGDFLTVENLTFKRPGTGVSPIEYWSYLGRPAERSYHEDEMI